MNKYFCYPVEYIGISGGFGGSHKGIDFGWESGHSADSKILAAADGVVKTVSSGWGIGNYIIIQHGQYQARYGHLSDNIFVRVNQIIKIGQLLAYMGHSGEQCSGTHLHYDMIEGTGDYDLTKRIDPTPLLYAYTDQRIAKSQTDKLNKVNYSFAEAPREEDPEPAPVPVTATYTVQKGDTLSKIARAYGITLAEIKRLNPQIENYNLIYPGQIINVKPAEPKTYTVVKGDTLSKIARAHGITLAEIKRLNPQIKNFNLIYPGQIINVR